MSPWGRGKPTPKFTFSVKIKEAPRRRGVTSIQIRAATLEDIPTIAFVLRESFLEFEPLNTPGGFAATTPNDDQIRVRWSEGPVWVAISDGAVVGTVAAVVQKESHYVRSMAVLPTARGRDAGKSLLKEVEGYALEQGCTRLYLSTTPFLAQTIRLYERYGFQRIPEGPTDLFGTSLITMEKLFDEPRP